MDQAGTVSTFNVNPETDEASPVGAPVQLAPAGWTAGLYTSNSGRFLYLVWTDGTGRASILVYATDERGVPQLPVIQTVDIHSGDEFLVHPSGRFAYLLETTFDSEGNNTANIRLLHIDPNTGILKEDPKVQATYGPQFYFTTSFNGFSSDGSELYDSQNVSFDGTFGSDYDRLAVDPKTGFLKPGVAFFGTGGNWGEEDIAILADNFLGDFHIYEFPGSQLNLYATIPPYPNSAPPFIQCNLSMLAVCNTATDVYLDPSNEYIWFADPATQETHVFRVDIEGKQLIDTGSTVPVFDRRLLFSPDGTLIFARTNTLVSVYGFNAKTGKVSSGNATPITLTWDTEVYPSQRL